LRTLAIAFLAFCWIAGSMWAAAPPAASLRAQLKTAEAENDKEATAELSRRILETTPTDSAIWNKLANTQLLLKDFDRCASTLDRWEKAIKPPPPVIEDLRGDLAYQNKDYTEAERHWLAFIAAKPKRDESARTYEKLADLCVVQSRWRENLEFRSRVIALKDTAANRVTRATAFLRLHRWDEAYIDIHKANALDPSDEMVKEWLPQFERLEEFLPRIKALDAQIAKSPEDTALLLDRARAFTLADRPLLALEDCQQAMKLAPGSMRARIQTAEAFLDNSKPEDAAKLQVNRRLARGTNKHVAEQALRQLGAADVLLARNAKDADSLALRAKVLRELHQPTLSLVDARAALAIDDKSAAAHFEAAHDFDELNQPKEAIAHARAATELDPNDAVKWCFRGVLEAQRANFAEAIEAQTRSLALAETLFALEQREHCERRIGKIAEADVDLRRIHELAPAGNQ
jgi:tetratricopeptide (TPR) repeat protein